MKMSIAVVFSALSLGEKTLAKHAYVTLTTWLGRSVLIKVAHIFERTGLAMVGGAGGLYVAIELMRMETELFRNEWMVLLMILYGAFGFYVGIDLPNRLAQTVKFARSGEWSFGTDAAALASAAGTFFAALAVFLSVGIIVLDETARDGFRVLVGCGWAIGTSFQIAAGAIGRSTLGEPGVGKDNSMSLWTPEKLGGKAKEDAENDNYNPPHSWWPGRYSVGTGARDMYDRAFNLHHSDKDEY